MKSKISYLLLSFCLALTACYKETDVPVEIQFEVSAEGDNYTVPVHLNIENKTVGATYYKWTFEGGTPSSSVQRQTGNVIYSQAGEYTIRLEAWNDGQRSEKEYTFTVYPAMKVDFDVETVINSFAPAALAITNNSSEAVRYDWTFEGAEPATSQQREPQNIVYNQAGEYTITLSALNGFESFSFSRIIKILPALEVNFEVEPNFDDEDNEAPFLATLINKTVSGLTYQWSCTDAVLTNAQGENTKIHIANSGNYAVTLQANNNKETKAFTKNIVVKPNSNLYKLYDVKFGNKQSENTTGCYYSLDKRKNYLTNEVFTADEQWINLVFYSLGNDFLYNKFLSPTEVGLFDFYDLPNATATAYIHNLINAGINFSITDFNNMNNDNLLQTFNIQNNANTEWFSNTDLPKIILFQTADGRKGAIKVKETVIQNGNSYVLTDIKFQKQQTN